MVNMVMIKIRHVLICVLKIHVQLLYAQYSSFHQNTNGTRALYIDKEPC